MNFYRSVRYLLALMVVGVTTCLPMLSNAAEAAIGRPSVIDADTIEIHGERIRLNGVDAPEARQFCQDAKGEDYRCGQAAALALDNYLAANRPTRCIEVDRDRYRRMVADCFTADGQKRSRLAGSQRPRARLATVQRPIFGRSAEGTRP